MQTVEINTKRGNRRGVVAREVRESDVTKYQKVVTKSILGGVDTLKSKFTNSGGGVGETNNEMIETLSTSQNRAKVKKNSFPSLAVVLVVKNQISPRKPLHPSKTATIKEPGRKVAIVTTATLP